MTKTRDLLVEIGTEELPPKALQNLAVCFADNLHSGLDNIEISHEKYQWYATPRRLAVVFERVMRFQPDHDVVRRGPALSAAYDESGVATKAATGACGWAINADNSSSLRAAIPRMR